MIRAWRIVGADYAETAFEGQGASLSGGRWNSRGHPVVYTSSTASLSALEVLVHLPRRKELEGFVLFAASFADELVTDVERQHLPSDWHAYPPPEELQQIGDSWILSESSAVLRAPSVIIDTEFNYLLNPAHRDFKKIEIADPVPFSLDLRLLRR